MRPTLLPGLMASLRHNFNRGIRSVNLFEIGRVFAVFPDDQLPVEHDALALVSTGTVTEGDKAQGSREVDFFDLKGALESAVAAMNLGPLDFKRAESKHLQRGQAASIMLADGQKVGTIGRLSDTVNAAHKFRQPVYVAELDLTTLLDSAEKIVQYHPLARYPSVMRDVTLLVPRDVTLDEILHEIDSQAVEDCRGARLVGTYEGPGVAEDRRSVTLRIEYRSDVKTLRDEEVEDRQRTLVSALCRVFNAEQH
jgi:phenylalanyl-tRNA synthetase beta chain